MATISQLPSGNWHAVVYFKGERIPFTDNSEAVVRAWAEKQEESKKNGRFRDPRRSRITLTEWHRLWLKSRVVADLTTAREDTTWRIWVEPEWGDWTLEELQVGRGRIKEWIKELVDNPDVGTATIHNIAKLLGKLLADAVDEERIDTNPAVRLDVPTAPLKPPFFWTHDEAGAIVEATAAPYHILVDFDLHVGPRIEELAGLLVDCIDLRLGLAHIVRVAVDKKLRDYPKTTKSYRTVPIPDHLVDQFGRQAFGKAPGDPLFTAPRGGFLDDNNFRNRIFNPALRKARMCECELYDDKNEPVLCEIDRHMVRWGSPNDMRHTAASWQVMAGVDLYRVQDLLGHEKYSTTQRYAHLDPSKHAAIRQVWGSGGLTSTRRKPRFADEKTPSS